MERDIPRGQAHIHTANMAVTIMKMNLRGKYFEVNVESLSRSPHSRLSRLSHGEEKVPLDSRGCYFYDRNPELFNRVLDYYSTGTLDVPSTYPWDVVRDDLEFWELPHGVLSAACQARYAEEREFWRAVTAVDAYKDRYELLAEGASCQGLAAKTRKIWNFLEMPRCSRFSMVSQYSSGYFVISA